MHKNDIDLFVELGAEEKIFPQKFKTSGILAQEVKTEKPSLSKEIRKVLSSLKCGATIKEIYAIVRTISPFNNKEIYSDFKIKNNIYSVMYKAKFDFGRVITTHRAPKENKVEIKQTSKVSSCCLCNRPHTAESYVAMLSNNNLLEKNSIENTLKKFNVFIDKEKSKKTKKISARDYAFYIVSNNDTIKSLYEKLTAEYPNNSHNYLVWLAGQAVLGQKRSHQPS